MNQFIHTSVINNAELWISLFSIPIQFVLGMNEEDLKIIDYFNLSAHPEGGWYRRTYSSQETVNIDRGKDFAGSSIYYFLGAGESSSLHSLLSDETWYFHFGLRLHYIFFPKKSIQALFLVIHGKWTSSSSLQFRGSCFWC